MKKHLPIELSRYVKNCVVEASRRKFVYNDWSTKVLKGHTRAVKCLCIMKEVYQGYRIIATRRYRKNESEAKSIIPRALKTKLPRNQHNNKIKFSEKFCVKVPKSTREALMMYMMNNNTLCADAIIKEMSAL